MSGDHRRYMLSPAARAASDYYNALPFEERQKIAPLLEHYRQMGLADAASQVGFALTHIDDRIREIREEVGQEMVS